MKRVAPIAVVAVLTGLSAPAAAAERGVDPKVADMLAAVQETLDQLDQKKDEIAETFADDDGRD